MELLHGPCSKAIVGRRSCIEFNFCKMASVKHLIVILAVVSTATAGKIGAGICYAGCAAVAVACFAGAGAVFGTVPGSVIAASPALAACNTAFGVCEAACVAAVMSRR